MAQKKPDTRGYDDLKAAMSNGCLANLYIFHGEEKYLMERQLINVRKVLVSGDFADFNHKKFSGHGLSIDELNAACDALPMFAERTLVEVHDFDLSKAGEEVKDKLTTLITDLPEYVCLIFVFDIVEYKPDGRQKFSALLKKEAQIVEFSIQEQSQLVKWIKAHFAETGKKIDTPTAEHLAFVTGGQMALLNVEIEKISAYIPDTIVTRASIDTVVTPVLDAISYQLTDHIAGGGYDEAAAVLVDLLSMREPPHKLMFSISLKLRQLMAARLLQDKGLGEKQLMTLCGIRFDFQARSLMASARKTTLEQCRRSVLLSAGTAYRLNTGGDPEKLLTELLIDLAACKRSAR